MARTSRSWSAFAVPLKAGAQLWRFFSSSPLSPSCLTVRSATRCLHFRWPLTDSLLTMSSAGTCLQRALVYDYSYAIHIPVPRCSAVASITQRAASSMLYTYL